MEIPVGRLIAEYIVRLGGEYVFGIPGAHILPVFDALYDSPVKPILAKHEQGASFMACGYARQSGKIGICIATAGPGATNLVTGLANAYMDRLPVLAITGETPTYSFGRGALQESSGEGMSINQGDIFRGITKYNTIVQRTDYLLNQLGNATGILLSKRPGPVLLSFPFNVLKETVDGALLDSINFSRRFSGSAEDDVPLEELMELIRASSNPVIVAGHGCILSGAEIAIAEFSSRMNIPIATTLKARGILPESSSRCLGVLGITSNEVAFRYIQEKSDLVIIAGASFGERTSYNWNGDLLKGKKLIQIDHDPRQLNKAFTAHLALNCDIRKVFECINRRVVADPAAAGPIRTEDAPAYKTRYANNDVKDNEFLLVSHFLKKLNEHFKGEVSVFDDNIIYMQRFCAVSKSRTYFPNSGLSSLGHAIPAAIGAKLASSKPVIALLGDGGFQMCCMELMTAVNYGIPVTVVLLNNSVLGLVRKNQLHNYGGRFVASDFINPDYGKLAASFGINHYRILSPQDAETVLKAVDFEKGINVIELILSKNEFPKYSSGR